MKYLIYIYVIIFYMVLFYSIVLHKKYTLRMNKYQQDNFSLEKKSKFFSDSYSKISFIQFIGTITSGIIYIFYTNIQSIEIKDTWNIGFNNLLIIICIVAIIFCFVFSILWQNKIEIKYNIELGYITRSNLIFIYFPFLCTITIFGIKEIFYAYYKSNYLFLLYFSIMFILMFILMLFIIKKNYLYKFSRYNIHMSFFTLLIIYIVLLILVDMLI